MQNTNSLSLRRSSRVPATVPILVTSLEPGTNFSEVCETTVVSAHGCAIMSPIKLKTGAPLQFHSKDGRETTAQVVYCKANGTDQQAWTLGASLDQPENFWGLKSCPRDWTPLPVAAGVKLAAAERPATPEQVAAASANIVLEKIRRQLSDEHLKALLAELLRPLAAELAGLKAIQAQSAHRNRFEVSLSQIPPELEQQLELRLRSQLGPRVLEEARQQSGQVLEAAKAAIAQKTTQTHDEFRQRVAKEMQAVEQRTQGMASDLAQKLREYLNRGLGELHQEVADSGSRLKQLSQELLNAMQHTLGEEHDARRAYLEQLQAVVKSESARLQAQIADLDRRMAKLDESACQLESGLDKRLSQMASDTVRTARSHMEGVLEVAMNELSTRTAQEFAVQLEEICSKLKIVQNEVEASVSDSLRLRCADAMQSFERSMESMAQQCLERWRFALAGGLNSLVRTLGEQFVLQATDSTPQVGSSGPPHNGIGK